MVPPQPEETPNQPDLSVPSQPVETLLPENGNAQLGEDTSVLVPDVSFGQSLAPVTPRKPSKELLMVFAGLGAVVLLMIIGIILYLVFFYISRPDYVRAGAQTSSVTMTSDAVSAASDSYFQTTVSDFSTDAQIASSRADYDTANTAYQSAIQSLSSERALKDSAVKEAYNTFVAKNKSFTASSDSLIQSMPLIRETAVDCSKSKIGTMDITDLSKVVAAYDKAVGPCASAMKELSAAKNVNTAAVGKKAVKYFADMRTHIVAMQSAYIAKNRALFETEYNAFLSRAKLLTAEVDLSGIQKQQSSLSPSRELSNLASVIQSRE